MPVYRSTARLRGDVSAYPKKSPRIPIGPPLSQRKSRNRPQPLPTSLSIANELLHSMLSRGFTIPIVPSYARLRGLVQPLLIPKSLPPGCFSDLVRYQALGIKRYTLGNHF